MARLEMPSSQALSPEQSEAVQEVLRGRRGRVPVPMIAWLRNPELARRLQKVGELLRFQTSIEPHLTELAILVCARHWTSHVEWGAHKALALQAGLDADVIAALAARREPKLDSDRARAVYEVARSLLNVGRVPDTLYRFALAALGEQGVVEVVGITGYYCTVSFTLNTFELGLPENVAAELEDPDYPVNVAAT